VENARNPPGLGADSILSQLWRVKIFFCLLFIMILENIIKVLVILGVPENERCKCEKK